MAIYGYARVSHVSQSLDVQIEALKAAGWSVIRAEKKSGTSLQDRTELKTLLDFVRSGDILEVTRIDRIARSTADLFDILRLETKGVALKATEQPIDTSTALGKSLLAMIGVFAELETNLRPRAPDGVPAASRRSTARSRSTSELTRAARPRFSPMRCAALKDEERLGASEIAQRLGIGRASVYRVLKEASMSA
jgi:DNA invertase Pin-like site-specific DNA recombinase